MVKYKKKLVIMLIIIMSINLFPVQANAAKKVELNKKKLSLYVGESFTLKLKNNKKKVKWSSSKKNVATVSKTGKVMAKKIGTCKIVAKVEKKKYSCNITVKNRKIEDNDNDSNFTSVPQTTPDINPSVPTKKPEPTLIPIVTPEPEIEPNPTTKPISEPTVTNKPTSEPTDTNKPIFEPTFTNIPLPVIPVPTAEPIPDDLELCNLNQEYTSNNGMTVNIHAITKTKFDSSEDIYIIEYELKNNTNFTISENCLKIIYSDGTIIRPDNMYLGYLLPTQSISRGLMLPVKEGVSGIIECVDDAWQDYYNEFKLNKNALHWKFGG